MKYRVNIDGRLYEGKYSSAANAVFGAMLKDEGEAGNGFSEMAIVVQELPEEPKMKGYRRSTVACKGCGSKLRHMVSNQCPLPCNVVRRAVKKNREAGPPPWAVKK